jgi:hypothetical protein
LCNFDPPTSTENKVKGVILLFRKGLPFFFIHFRICKHTISLH